MRLINICAVTVPYFGQRADDKIVHVVNNSQAGRVVLYEVNCKRGSATQYFTLQVQARVP